MYSEAVVRIGPVRDKDLGSEQLLWVRVFTESINLKMAMRQILNEIRGMKVKDVPAKVKPLFTVSNMKTSIQRALDNYHAKYIQTDSIQPLYHVCFGGMIFSYLVALPEERRHLEHQQHIKEHGGH